MRKGEAAGLQWEYIILKEGTISIRKTLDFQAVNEVELFGDTKTYSSKSTISINKSHIQDLTKHKIWQNDNKLDINNEYKHHLNLVFCRIEGSRLPKSTLFNAFSRNLKQASIPKLSINS